MWSERIIKLAWERGSIPGMISRKPSLFPFTKKGTEKSVVTDTVSLVGCTLSKKMQELVESYLGEEQFGLRNTRVCQDNMLTLRRLSEKFLGAEPEFARGGINCSACYHFFIHCGTLNNLFHI